MAVSISGLITAHDRILPSEKHTHQNNLGEKSLFASILPDVCYIGIHNKCLKVIYLKESMQKFEVINHLGFRYQQTNHVRENQVQRRRGIPQIHDKYLKLCALRSRNITETELMI